MSLSSLLLPTQTSTPYVFNIYFNAMFLETPGSPTSKFPYGIPFFTSVHRGRDSSVDIATRYGLDGPGIEFRRGARYFAPARTGPRVYPASYTMGTGTFLGVKRQGRGVDHPPLLAPRLKEE